MVDAVVGVGLVILASIIEGVSQTFFKKSALVALRKKAWVAGGIALLDQVITRAKAQLR